MEHISRAPGQVVASIAQASQALKGGTEPNVPGFSPEEFVSCGEIDSCRLQCLRPAGGSALLQADKSRTAGFGEGVEVI
jgi:hypothetical protein